MSWTTLVELVALPACSMLYILAGGAILLRRGYWGGGYSRGWREGRRRWVPLDCIDNSRVMCQVLQGLFSLLCAIVAFQTGEDGRTTEYWYRGFFYSCSCVYSLISLLLHLLEMVKRTQEDPILRLAWWILLGVHLPYFLRSTALLADDDAMSSITTAELFYSALIAANLCLYCLCNAHRRHTNWLLGRSLMLETDVETSEYHRRDERRLPELDCGTLSFITFSWMNTLVAKGRVLPLQETNLYDLHPSDNAEKLAKEFQVSWNGEKLRGTARASLLRSLWAAFGKTFVMAGLFKACNDVLQFVGPFILSRLLSYLATRGTSEDSGPRDGYRLVFTMFCAAIVQSLCLHQYFHRGMRTGMRLKSAVTTAVYRKTLKIVPGAQTNENVDEGTSDKTSGKIVNLMSIDAQRLQDVCTYAHVLWSAPLQIVLALIMLWTHVGAAVLAGIFVMLITAPLSAILGRRMRNIQMELMKVKDERIKITNEMLSAMKIIKLYSWEDSFRDKVTFIRNKELNFLWRYQIFQVFVRLLFMTVPVFVTAATFLMYVAIYRRNMDAKTAFTSLALFNILRFPVQFLPLMINYLMEAKVSLSRIQEFLENPEIVPVERKPHPHESSPRLTLQNATLAWSSGKTLLQNATINCYSKELTIVCGPTGSGKSGLISALIGDVNVAEGSLTLYGSAAYASQVAWIQNNSVRENILFGKPFDTAFYDAVVSACALESDFAMLPAGDDTEIGEKGINLSGGQRQRISLARAVYQDADIYLLDDCLSAVDGHVANHIFEQVILGFLRLKCVVLVTHRLDLVPRADKVVLLRAGRMEYCGDYTGFALLRGDYAEFVAAVRDKESDNEQIANNRDGDARNAVEIVDEEQSGADDPKRKQHHSSSNTDSAAESGGALIEAELMETGNVSAEVYRKYLVGCGGILLLIGLVAAMMLQQLGGVASSSWVTYWVDHPSLNRFEAIGVYSSFCVLQAAVTLGAILVTAVAGQRGGRFFHNKLLCGILNAPMSFFDTTPLGRILNRFSKDTYTIDEALPNALFSYCLTLFAIVATICVIGVIVPWFLAGLIPLGYIYLRAQMYYIPTSRQLKRIDSVLRSPIFVHFAETLDGVATLRAFQAQQRFVVENERRVDLNLRAYYLNIASNRWLAVRLEFVGTCVVAFTALLAVSRYSPLTAGLGGMAITYGLSITQTLNWMVRMASEREINIVSVERVSEYGDTLAKEAQAIIPGSRPPQGWPTAGAIEFKEVKLRYREGLPLVLKGVSLSIKAGERVGIVGRTGAGKSSMFLPLLRLVELSHGQIIVDGVDISKIGLKDLRSQLSIIPQDPVLFIGTIRSNLDPFDEYTDTDIKVSLERAHLDDRMWDTGTSLDSLVEEGGRNFSLGERQLMCLARALLRKSKVLILDEATSAVDAITDKLIQKSIRIHFRGSTILTIAHRIDTILDYDRIAVMDAGTIIELDKPKVLYDSPASQFRALADTAGVSFVVKDNVDDLVVKLKI